MTTSTHPSPARPAHRAGVAFAAATTLLALALVLHGPIAQWAGYHDFADQRSLWGLPHAADVLSNLPFALVGLWAWARLRGAAGDAARVWRAFALALLATAAGSSFYHWAPDNAALVLDRLPIAAACTLLSCAFLAERLDRRWARPPTLAAALLAASLSVGLWWASELAGRSDLRAYLFVQFLPMLLVPLGLLRRVRPVSPQALPNAAWWSVLAGYGAAKLFELGDQAVLQATGQVSGHTLKHLCAALAAGALLRAAVISSGSRR